MASDTSRRRRRERARARRRAASAAAGIPSDGDPSGEVPGGEAPEAVGPTARGIPGDNGVRHPSGGTAAGASAPPQAAAGAGGTSVPEMLAAALAEARRAGTVTPPTAPARPTGESAAPPARARDVDLDTAIAEALGAAAPPATAWPAPPPPAPAPARAPAPAPAPAPRRARPPVQAPEIPERAFGRSRLPAVLAVIGVGLVAQGGADAFARSGRYQTLVLPLFFLGLVVIFLPCAWRLLDTGAGRRERIQVSVTLGLALLISYVMRSPLLFDGFDELLHGATLMQLLDGRVLFTQNTFLPVSPYYPGLELLTITVKWLTGLPLVLSEVLVLAAARLVLVLCVFAVTERVARSARAGGIGVLAYAASPQFYSFNAQFAYQTLALAFSVAAVHFLLEEIDQPEPRMGRRSALAAACIGGVVVTHHLTGWLTVGFLVLWAVGLARGHHRAAARTVGAAALLGTVTEVTWTGLVGHRLLTYLTPIFQDAVAGLSSAIGGLHSNRPLFHDAAGGGSPLWEIAVMLAAAAAWCLLLLPSLHGAIWHRTIRGGGFRWVAVVAAACYPLTLLASLSASSSQVGDRASTFVFFGVAVVVGGWLARRLGRRRSVRERVLSVAIAAVCFLGSMIFGSGPDWSYVPGPFLVGADQRSVGAPSIAAALWVGSHLPAGAHIAADRANGSLLDDLAHVDPVTAIGGLVNVGPIYFSPTMGSFQLSLVRQGQIRYLLVDDRLVESLPQFGIYFEPGETKTPERLTRADLAKFAAAPGVRLIYDNGPIQIYDLASLLGTSSRAPVAGPVYGQKGTGVDWVILGLAMLVALAWIRRARRRAPPALSGVIAGLVGTMAAGILFGFLVVPTTLAPRPLAIAVLAVLGVCSLWPSPGTVPSAVRRERARRSGGMTIRPAAVAALALAVVGVALAVIPARSEWVPPAQLSVAYVAPGKAVAEVELGSAGPVPSRLEIVAGGEVVYDRAVGRVTGDQLIALPPNLPLAGATIRLVVGPTVLRAVTG